MTDSLAVWAGMFGSTVLITALLTVLTAVIGWLFLKVRERRAKRSYLAQHHAVAVLRPVSHSPSAAMPPGNELQPRKLSYGDARTSLTPPPPLPPPGNFPSGAKALQGLPAWSCAASSTVAAYPQRLSLPHEDAPISHRPAAGSVLPTPTRSIEPWSAAPAQAVSLPPAATLASSAAVAPTEASRMPQAQLPPWPVQPTPTSGHAGTKRSSPDTAMDVSEDPAEAAMEALSPVVIMESSPVISMETSPTALPSFAMGPPLSVRPPKRKANLLSVLEAYESMLPPARQVGGSGRFGGTLAGSQASAGGIGNAHLKRRLGGFGGGPGGASTPGAPTLGAAGGGGALGAFGAFGAAGGAFHSVGHGGTLSYSSIGGSSLSRNSLGAPSSSLGLRHSPTRSAQEALADAFGPDALGAAPKRRRAVRADGGAPPCALRPTLCPAPHPSPPQPWTSLWASVLRVSSCPWAKGRAVRLSPAP